MHAALITMAEDGSEPKLDDKTDKDAITWIGSSMTLGALCGALFSGTISQFFGRKKALIIYGIPFTIGWVLLVLAKNVTLLIVGRVVCGISCGLLSGTAPSYVVEISTIDIRGMIGACFQVIFLFIFFCYRIYDLIFYSSFSSQSASFLSIYLELLLHGVH